jgi:hypothetical protein
MIENYHLFIDDAEKLLQTALGKKEIHMPSLREIKELRRVIFSEDLGSNILRKENV